MQLDSVLSLALHKSILEPHSNILPRKTEKNRGTVKSKMELDGQVVIIGAGIAGLATALALKRIGIRSLVLEKAETLRTTGAALTLADNAWKALDALGVADKLTSMYTPFQKNNITDVPSGITQATFLYPPNERVKFGLRSVHRRTLLETIAQELPDDGIRFSSKLRSIETVRNEGATTAVLGLEDGTVIRAKIVVGCDGVHSVVGQWLGLKEPMHSGRSAVRGLAVFPQGHELKHEAQMLVDGGTRAGMVPMNDKEVYWFSVYATDEDTSSKSAESMQKSILDELAHFPATFLNVVRHADVSTLSWAPLMFRVPWDLLLQDMYKDNITVAGDAMHPMTPDLGQGGCQSLEDAIILVRNIGNAYALNGKLDSSGLKGYVKERRLRAAVVIAASYFSGWVQQGPSGWLKKLVRDKVFYKFFPLIARNIVRHNCGGLPSVCVSAEEKNAKKLE